MEIIPNQYFIGTLPSRETKIVDFTFTPLIEADLSFVLYYQTGDNKHQSEVTLPLHFSSDKKQADMALSSVSFSTLNGVEQITGDITNIGLEAAYSVTVTVGEGVNPVFPYKDYVLGTLNADDFASFQLTFEPIETSSAGTLILTFKDKDGNSYIQSFSVELNQPTNDATFIASSPGSFSEGRAMMGMNRGGGVRMTTGGGGGRGPNVMVGSGPIQRPGSVATETPSDSPPLLLIAVILLFLIGGAYSIRHKKQTGKKMGKKGWKDLKLMKEIESYDAGENANDSDQSATSHTPDEK
jgi:hypothetical protein